MIALSKIHLESCYFTFCTTKLFKYFNNVIVLVNKVFGLFFFKWKSNGTKLTSFYRKTWVQLWQIPQNLLNNHFTNVIIQKVTKTKFVNKYSAYDRMKNKMIKMQHNINWKLIWWQYVKKLARLAEKDKIKLLSYFFK